MNNITKVFGGLVFAFILLAFAFKPTFASTGGSYGSGHMDGVYTASLSQANHSGVWGNATFTMKGNKLTVEINAYGLQANKLHMQHIHGFANNMQSRCATPSDDKNKNGWIELSEATAVAGPPLVTLASTYKGTEHLTTTYYLNASQMSHLTSRVIEIHGMSVHGKYDSSMPVACGRISFSHKLGNGHDYDNHYTSNKPDHGYQNNNNDCKQVSYQNNKGSYNHEVSNHYKGKGNSNSYNYGKGNNSGGYNNNNHNMNGYGSNNSIRYTVNNSTRISQSNTANVNNSVNIHANTGGNTASYNTRGSVNISTGNASTAVGIHNNVNSNYLSL